ncbi:MAG: hypothetical protein LAO77_12795 [Acidobacteriia bacterium]|nr:hypothetical protein [Terriglobia bacterium]
MPVTIGELTTEVIAEDAAPAASAGAAAGDEPQHLTMIRAQMAAVARETMRTRAEGFDD